jgi:hypothetical protein
MTVVGIRQKRGRWRRRKTDGAITAGSPWANVLLD